MQILGENLKSGSSTIASSLHPLPPPSRLAAASVGVRYLSRILIDTSNWPYGYVHEEHLQNWDTYFVAKSKDSSRRAAILRDGEIQKVASSHRRFDFHR
eukprot:scaffold11639_cov172-Amphora_coffeaeformis.AAC.22